MGLDKPAVVDGLKRFDMIANRLNDHILNLRGGDPAHRSGPLGLPLQEGGGKVISVSHPLLAGVARGHAITPVVEQASHQQSVRTRPQGLVKRCVMSATTANILRRAASGSACRWPSRRSTGWR